jgi:CHAT domain-containing protein
MDIFSQFSVARELLQRGELEQALVEVDRVIGLFGKSVEALELQVEIREAIVAKNRSPESEAEIWFDQGNSQIESGDFVGAIESFNEALQIKPHYYEAWNNRGVALGNLGQYEAAIASFNEALQIKPHYHEAWNNRGIARRKLGQYETAISSYDTALQIKPDDHLIWYNRSFSAFSARGKSEPNAYTLKHPELNQRGYPGRVASLTVGLIYCPAATHPLGHGTLQRELGDAHWDHARTQASPRPYWREALKAYNASLRVLTASDHPESRLQTLQKLIRTHLALTELPAARHYQTEGITLFQQLRAIARNKRQFEAQFSDFRRTEIDLLIGENAPTQALEQAEFYKNRALTWILNDWQETVLSPNYSQMRQLLTANTAIVYWHLSDDALTTFMLTPDNPEPIVLSTDRYQQSIDLKKLIDEYKKDYKTYRELPKEAKKDNHPWRLKLQSWLDRLKQILDIGTIETHIGNAQNIILLPHRDLHLLPIHAGFADRFICTYLPSIQIGLNQSTRSPDRGAPTLLNIDDPIVDGQPPLVYSRLESAIVRALFPQTTRLTGTAATHEATIAALKQPHSIFHFSGHGRYDEYRPENSAIGLTNQNLTAKTIATLNLAAYELINLAACETGITGKGTIATEYVGLASACLKARAGNVLSTLWQVDELSSAWLGVRFYQAYLAGEPAADALSIAQTWLQTLTYQDLIHWLEQLQAANPLGKYCQKEIATQIMLLNQEMGTMGPTAKPYAHPYYWVGFILTGGRSS